MNMPAEPTQGTAKFLGVGALIQGVANFGSSLVNSGTDRAAIEATERAYAAEQMARTERQKQAIALITKLATTAAIVFVVYLILR